MTDLLRIVVGADAAGLAYKNQLKADLELDERVESVVDVGVQVGEDTDYPHIAVAAVRKVANGQADRALLVCGTGVGVAIAANKVSGVRAATAHESYSAERAVLSNDPQVLCLGQRVIGVALARRLVKEWIGYEVDPTFASVAEIDEYEAGEWAPAPAGDRSAGSASPPGRSNRPLKRCRPTGRLEPVAPYALASSPAGWRRRHGNPSEAVRRAGTCR